METLSGNVLQNERQGEAYQATDTSDIDKPKFYLESYGCQMNFSDSEIVASILLEAGFESTQAVESADLILINTCAIRDNAEQRVRKRLSLFNSYKKEKPGLLIGVLGCMAERLKKKLLEEEQMVDLVVGPDAYRDLPKLVRQAEEGEKAVNVFLSREETYADVSPVRLDGNGVSAFISIMRGCDNMCSFCIVPFTRGRERSRNPYTVVEEARSLLTKGYREVTLLGQNVDSYRWENGKQVDFADLLAMVAELDPDMRIWFSTSHPKDITEKVVHTMARYPNICNYIHFPAQSGSTDVLYRMNRNHSHEWYLDKIRMMKRIIPDIGLSSDIMTGFCGETAEEHQETLRLMDEVRFDMSFMFYYSERPNTPASKKMSDDVPLATKKARLQEVIQRQQQHSLENNARQVGKQFQVLVLGKAKKSNQQCKGRNTHNRMIVFDDQGFEPGKYVTVQVNDYTSATLIGEPVNE